MMTGDSNRMLTLLNRTCKIETSYLLIECTNGRGIRLLLIRAIYAPLIVPAYLSINTNDFTEAVRCRAMSHGVGRKFLLSFGRAVFVFNQDWRPK